MSEKTYRGFEELEVWREARKLRQEIYSLSKKFPAEEKFVLLPQLRRAAISVTNNIAEGHGRYHYQENAQFLRLARGSLEEVLDDLTLCADEGYAPTEVLTKLRSQVTVVERLINGYVRYLLNQKAAQVKESPGDYIVQPITDPESPITDPESP